MIIVVTLAQEQSTATTNPIEDFMAEDHPALFFEVGDGKYVFQDFAPDVQGESSSDEDSDQHSQHLTGKFLRNYVLTTVLSPLDGHIQQPSNYECSCPVYQHNNNFIAEMVILSVRLACHPVVIHAILCFDYALTEGQTFAM